MKSHIYWSRLISSLQVLNRGERICHQVQPALKTFVKRKLTFNKCFSTADDLGHTDFSAPLLAAVAVAYLLVRHEHDLPPKQRIVD